MEQSEGTRRRLLQHYQQYPKLQIQDIFKFLHQSSFGCEHFVSALQTATDSIGREYETIPHRSQPVVEPLDGEYSRVHLSYLNTGLTAETLGKLFCFSAKQKPDGYASLIEKLSAATELIGENLLPFEADTFQKAVKDWEASGFPPVHHSDIFKKTYAPAYRIIANQYLPFLPLLAQLDKQLEKGAVKLAIEGGSASGKTTLSKLLSHIYDCAVFHMDDFFLRPEQRTPARYRETGGNIDRERFLDEVLRPLAKEEAITYRKFDCSSMTINSQTTITPKKLNIIEGVYSMHPAFSKYYNQSVFLDISPEVQRKRIHNRNAPQLAERFFQEWIPLENRYFSETEAKERCNLCIPIR